MYWGEKTDFSQNGLKLFVGIMRGCRKGVEEKDGSIGACIEKAGEKVF